MNNDRHAALPQSIRLTYLLNPRVANFTSIHAAINASLLGALALCTFEIFP